MNTLGALWEKVSQHSDGRNGRREQLRSWNATLWKGLVSHNPPEIEANSIHQPGSSSPSYPTQCTGFGAFPPKKKNLWSRFGGPSIPRAVGSACPWGSRGTAIPGGPSLPPLAKGIFWHCPRTNIAAQELGNFHSF